MGSKLFGLLYLLLFGAIAMSVAVYVIPPKIQTISSHLSTKEYFRTNIVKDDIQLITVARNITATCESVTCDLYQIRKYMLSEYAVDDNITDITVEELLHTRKGNNISLVGLFASMLSSIGVKYTVMQTVDGGLYLSVENIDEDELSVYIEGEHGCESLFSDRFKLASGQSWVRAPIFSENGERIIFTLQSNTAVHFFIFPDKYKINRSEYYKDCSYFDKSRIDALCYIKKDNTVVVTAGDTEADVTVAACRAADVKDDFILLHMANTPVMVENRWFKLHEIGVLNESVAVY